MSATNLFRMLADLVLLTHMLVVVFVIMGLLAVYLGKARRWHWVRNPWFRGAHLLCILVVAAQAIIGVVCPLTTLEMWLREQAGDHVYGGSFISHWLGELLYYDLPDWVFTLIYTAFAGLVALSWIWVRPYPLTTPRRNSQPLNGKP